MIEHHLVVSSDVTKVILHVLTSFPTVKQRFLLSLGFQSSYDAVNLLGVV